MGQRLAISTGGQISVPAAVRKRWGTRTVVAEDHGDHLVLRPAPDDPIEAVAGIFRHSRPDNGMTPDEERDLYREEELEAEERWRGA